MVIYHYDRSGEFLMAGEAKPSPADGTNPDGSPKAWLIPMNATSIQPPKLGLGEAALFDEEKKSWYVMEDHRGKAVWSTTDMRAHLMEVLGPVPEGYTLLPCPGPLSRWDGEKWVDDVEKLEAQARGQRNAKLTSCDWTQLPDCPLTAEQKTAWQAYRQALRDYMDGWLPGKPWPVEPK
jgi:hypothetical protein